MILVMKHDSIFCYFKFEIMWFTNQMGARESVRDSVGLTVCEVVGESLGPAAEEVGFFVGHTDGCALDGLMVRPVEGATVARAPVGVAVGA